MNTFEITASVVDGYINTKIGEERINFLIAQANEQIDEISQNQEMYASFLKQVNAPQKIDNLVLWILLMSDEDICSEYIKKCNKDFMKVVPMSDLSALLFHVIHLKKVQNVELDGFEYLSEYEDESVEELDQYSFTNAFLYVQELKEVKMEF